MKCTEFELLVNEYVDGELTHSQAELEEHMKTCQDCKNLYEETLELKQLLAGLDDIDLPQDFEETLHEKLVAAGQDNVRPIHKYRNTWKVLGSIAAVAIVSITVYTAMPRMGSDDAVNFAGASNDEVAYEMATESADAGVVMNMAVESESTEETEAAIAEMPTVESVTVTMADDVDLQAKSNVYTLRMMPSAKTKKGHMYQINGHVDSVLKIIETLDYKSLEILENQYIFYLKTEDVHLIEEKIMPLSSMKIEDIVQLDYSYEIDMIYENIKTLEEEIKRLEEEGSSDKEEISKLDMKRSEFADYQKALEEVEIYKGYEQIIMIISEE
ncbi:zf-HC2 domain-containing protein [Acidaminobacter sp. JC074]|uniref:anti-sigma factor family protein n=1 Tax=Acidaminobacter sp. JC074 TaxID=2530199 RepID=UPI001F0E8DEF|nr:zf-HC2 domain-containing protein [Acidaminobacter sp. JC074]MCH4889447.1 zf-HC2 domain-containing protein [Acidaminobacter sp. JC074]